MQARLSFLVLLFSALILPASPAFSAGGSGPSEEGISPRCEAAIDKAAGNYSRCLLKASAKFAKKGNEDRLFAQQMRCGDKFDAQVARAQDRFGEDQCTWYITQIADRTAMYAEAAATEASGMPDRSYLFVQNGTGGTLSEDTLTLTGVRPETGYFTDRPYRKAGQVPTEKFLTNWDDSTWDDGNNPFSEDPPNAEFTCAVDGKVVNFVVELSSPSMTGDNLSYSATAVGETVLPETPIACDGSSHVFFDSLVFNCSSDTGRGWNCPCWDNEECNSGMWCESSCEIVGGCYTPPPPKGLPSCSECACAWDWEGP